MDKLTKEEYREYLVSNIKMLDICADNAQSLSNESNIQMLHLLFDLTTALYKLDNDIK